MQNKPNLIQITIAIIAVVALALYFQVIRELQQLQDEMMNYKTEQALASKEINSQEDFDTLCKLPLTCFQIAVQAEQAKQQQGTQ